MIAAAEKTGKTVTSVTTPDGTVLHFGEPAAHRGEQPVARRSQGDEAMKLPKYVQHWVDHDGRAHCYFRRRGYPRVRLPGLPWSPSFMAAYEAALDRAAHRHRCGPHQAGQRERRRRRVFRLATILRLEKCRHATHAARNP